MIGKFEKELKLNKVQSIHGVITEDEERKYVKIEKNVKYGENWSILIKERDDGSTLFVFRINIMRPCHDHGDTAELTIHLPKKGIIHPDPGCDRGEYQDAVLHLYPDGFEAILHNNWCKSEVFSLW